jgi:LysM repeat protein
MEARHRTPARLLALVALIGAAIALLVIVSNSGNDSGPSESSSARSAEKSRDLGASPSRAERRAERRAAKKDKLPEDVYVVKSGDTLGGIAEKTGIPVERLQELNPGLDQFQLVAGQRIKLR